VQSRAEVPAPPPELAAASVTVVGDRWFGAVDSQLGAQAVALAARAGVELLTVQFETPRSGARFLCAELTIDVASDQVADALLARLITEVAA
jgi:hypothetical protein